MKIMSLGEHLSSDEQIDFTFAEIQQCLFKLMPSRFGVAIDSADSNLRKFLTQKLVDLFRTFANVVNVLACTGRALRRRALMMIAVMTDQRLIAAMIGECHVAIRTFDRFAT